MNSAQLNPQGVPDVGEVKNSTDYAQAVPQLGHRLAALRWLLQAGFGVPPGRVRLVGRMFVAGARNRAAARGGSYAAQQQQAALEWGFKLLVHWV